MAAQQDMAAVIADARARLARGESLGKPVKQSKPDEAYSLLVAAKGWCGEGDYESAFVAAYDAVAILEKLADKQRAKRTK